MLYLVTELYHNVETALPLGFTEVSCTVPSSPMCERPCGACSWQDAADAAGCGRIRQFTACYELCEVAAQQNRSMQQAEQQLQPQCAWSAGKLQA